MTGNAPSPWWLAHAKLVAVALFWGSSLVSARIVAQSIPTFTAGSARFVLASAIFAVILLRHRPLQKLNTRQWVAVSVMGLFGVFLFNFFFFTALGKVPASKAGLIVSLGPVLTALAVASILREPLGMQRWIGILLALLGVNIVITRGDLSQFWSIWSGAFDSGEGYMFLCVFSWMVFTVISRFALKGLSALTATSYSALIGTGLLLLSSLGDIADWRMEMLTATNILALGFIAVFGTVVANFWYVQGVQALGPTRTVVYTNLVPIFGVLLGYIILSEPIDLSMALGGTIVIAGVMLTNRSKA